MALRKRTTAILKASRRIHRYEGAIKNSHPAAASNRKEIARSIKQNRKTLGRKRSVVRHIKEGRNSAREMGY